MLKLSFIRLKFFFKACFLYLVFVTTMANAQCTVVSTCGYNVGITLKTLSIIPSSTSCPFGYNYNVRFSYMITVSGINTCYDGSIGIQPQVFCSGQNNGYYTINVAAPTVGAGGSSVSYTGTLTTSTNPFRSLTDCSTATPASLNCNSAQVTIFGPGISNQTISCTLSTLPIELLYFRAKCEQRYIALTWSTATEKNNNFFTIEKSSDALAWNELGMIKGSGTSSVVKNYAFNDVAEDTKTEVFYYRLKQTDFNGSYKYSSVISLENCNVVMKGDLIIYPNPVTEMLHLKINGVVDPTYSVRIYGPMGNEVYQSDSFQSSIDLSSFPNGIYVVQVFNASTRIIQKVILEK